MQNPPFRFKQFEIEQNGCAMKINTDGVLLGAWADVEGAKDILDIGTGTGVIALMVAQRNADAKIDAIDIDQDAYERARQNMLLCKWADRLKACHTALQNFFPGKKYDAIISNPPYFVDDYKTENAQRNIARHSTELSYQDLLAGINRLLAEAGKAFLVIPVFNLAQVEAIGAKQNLFVTGATQVIAVSGKPPYVVLIQLERAAKEFLKKTIEIQNADGSFTSEYMNLAKEFYLKF